jgi:hypothetical protein
MRGKGKRKERRKGREKRGGRWKGRGRVGEGEVCIDFLCGPRVYWLDSLDSYHFAKLDFRQLSGLRRASSGDPQTPKAGLPAPATT